MTPSVAAGTSKTYFREGSKLPASEAEATYDALSRTPFVNLCATASELEEFAELVAWHEILKQHQGDLVIEVKMPIGTLDETPTELADQNLFSPIIVRNCALSLGDCAER